MIYLSNNTHMYLKEKCVFKYENIHGSIKKSNFQRDNSSVL